MIVRDEARVLDRCLKSVRDWVGEMVVVDTGSTDNTIAIARANGAQVSNFTWCDDFSAARNASLARATREWVLILDADETLIVENPREFAKALTDSGSDGFSIAISSANDDGTRSSARLFRLFRRTVTGMRYRGEVHEQLEAVAAGASKVSYLACLHLDHDGYLSHIVAGKEKSSRNVRLAKKVAQSRPNDPFSWFVLATAIGKADPEAMLEAAAKAFALLDSRPGNGRGEQYVVNLYLAVIDVYAILENTNLMVRVCDQAISVFPDSPDLRCNRGQARMISGDDLGALEDFSAALTTAAQSFIFILDNSTCGYGARTALGRVLRRLGKVEDAVTQLQLATEQSPVSYCFAHAELGATLLELNHPEQALPLLEEARRRAPTSSEVAIQLAWCWYKLKHLQAAERTLREFPDDPQSSLLLGRVLLESGKADQALSVLSIGPRPAAFFTIGWAHLTLGQLSLADQAWDSWLNGNTQDDPRKSPLSMFRLLLSDSPIAASTSDEDVRIFSEMGTWLCMLIFYGRDRIVEYVIDRARLTGPLVWPSTRKRWSESLVLAGYVELGVRLLVEAATESPNDAAPYYWLGYCAMIQLQTEEARAMFMECLRCDPMHSEGRQSLALLNTGMSSQIS